MLARACRAHFPGSMTSTPSPPEIQASTKEVKKSVGFRPPRPVQLSGQFAQFISSPTSAFLSLSGPIYNPDPSVDVTLTRTPFGAVAGLTANQRAVGNALEAGYSTTLTGPAATLYTNLLMTGTPDALS